MDFSVQIEGLDKLNKASEEIRASVAREMAKGLYASAKQVEGEAKRSILQGGKSGRVYKRRTVTHQSSAPGEAPANWTGRLVNSINTELHASAFEAIIRAGSGLVKYAKMLEFGTRRMAARPFMFPALEKSKQFIRDRLAQAFKAGIARGK